MQHPGNLGQVEFGGPATYRIVVQGTLSEEWSDRLAGMMIATYSRGEDPSYTVLKGPIQDQAQLSGVLEILYGLHLPILRVEMVEGT